MDRPTNDTTVTGLFCPYERTLTDNARGLYYTSVLKIVLRSAKLESIIACTHAIRQNNSVTVVHSLRRPPSHVCVEFSVTRMFTNSGFEFSLSQDMLTEYF